MIATALIPCTSMDPTSAPEDSSSRRVARFGPFELDLNTGELRKHGIRIRLQAKPLEVLRALLAQPGIVVHRAELRKRLWPDETFVDFENGLNTAINRLRSALGDSAENPRYVETLARSGYRFIAPVSAAAEPLRVRVVPLEPAPLRRHARWPWIASAVLALAAAAVLHGVWPRPQPVSFRQLTFRRGQVAAARFLPDGQGVIYGARWESGAQRLFVTSALSPESRSLGFTGVSLGSVSRNGELALLSLAGTMNINGSALSRVPINGGAPLEVDRSIMSCDWSPEGKLAIVRAVRGTNQLEYPPGNLLYRTPGWLAAVRVSPDGRRVAFIDHPVRHDDGGAVKLFTSGAGVTTLASDWFSVAGLAWYPSGKEVWFTAARRGNLRSVWASDLTGRLRPVAQAPGTVTIRDISRDGRVLMTRDMRRLEISGRVAGEGEERTMSWLDWSRVQEISADGSLLLFDESGEGTGLRPVTYLHRTIDGSTTRIGEGRAIGIAPDLRSVVTLDNESRTRFQRVPLSGGTPRELPASGLEYQWARLFPDGQRLLALASEHGRALRLYVQRLEGGGKPLAITPEMVVRNVAISPDGTEVAVLEAGGRLAVYRTDAAGDRPRILGDSEPLAPIRWSRDGQWIFVQHVRAYTELPSRVSRIHATTGRLHAWRELMPADRVGVNQVTGVVISDDQRSYAYSYRRVLSELFVVDGWR